MPEDISIVAAHFDEHEVSFRGHIDTIHSATGIEGWAVDIARRTERLRLQCVVDAEILADCETDRPREDVRQLARCHALAGFRLPPDIFTAAARLVETHAAQKIAIRIAGTSYHLPFSGNLPTVREIAALVRPVAAQSPRQLVLPPSPAVPAGGVLHQASALLAYPLRAAAENLHGRVELMSKDVLGELWIGGWMKKGHALSFPAILHDGQKHPAMVELVGYDRGDLPPGTMAVFGVVRSAWTPSPEAEDLLLFFGEEGRFYLRWNKPLKYQSIDDMLRLFEEVRPRCHAGQSADMVRAIASVGNWSPGVARVAGFAAEAHADRMLVVPHFGVLVEGWVLSPVKTVDQLMLRIGGAVLRADANSLYRKRRADLAAIFPGPDEFLDRRGFVAAFRGDISADHVTDPVLKIVFTDRTSTNHAVDARIVRRLGHSANVGDVLPFYPNIQSEPFFGDFATAVGRALRDSMVRGRPYHIGPADRAMVIALPNSRADIYLLFDELARRVARKLPPLGIAFVLGDNERRSDVIPLFQELTASCSCPCSLFIGPNVDYALYTLPDVLRAVGASRFVYVGANVVLSETGWKTAVRFLAQETDALLFFGVDEDPESAPSDARVSECFGWSTAEFVAWVADSPTMVGGSDAGLVMPWTGVRSPLCRGAAWRRRSPNPDWLAALVNQEALRQRALLSIGRA